MTRVRWRRQDLVPHVQPLSEDAVRLESEPSEAEPEASPPSSRSASPAAPAAENGRSHSPEVEGPAPPPVIKRTVTQVSAGGHRQTARPDI